MVDTRVPPAKNVPGWRVPGTYLAPSPAERMSEATLYGRLGGEDAVANLQGDVLAG